MAHNDAVLGLRANAAPEDVDPEFAYSIERRGDAVVLSLDGELDLVSISNFENAVEALLDPPRPRVVVDLGGLTFIESTGVRGFLRLHRRLADQAQLELLALIHRDGGRFRPVLNEE